MNEGWIGVDLDGTIAKYDTWQGNEHVGEPIKPMIYRVKRWLVAGQHVKIFTARCHGIGQLDIETGKPLTEEQVKGPIRKWLLEHLGEELEITNVKDFQMIELWDDRAVSVSPNNGNAFKALPDGGVSQVNY